MAHRYTCRICVFEVRAEEETEVEEVARGHVQREHDEEIEDDDVRHRIEEVQIG